MNHQPFRSRTLNHLSTHPHWANLVDKYFESDSDLNLIEKLCDCLGKAVAQRYHPPRGVNVPMSAFLDDWIIIPQTLVDKIIAGNRTRGGVCIRQ